MRRLRVLAAWAFLVINGGGGLYALATGEVQHALVHAVLFVVGLYALRYVRDGAATELVASGETEARMARLQQSLDAIAIEVERIGEAQRFAAKKIVEQDGHAPLKPE